MPPSTLCVHIGAQRQSLRYHARAATTCASRTATQDSPAHRIPQLNGARPTAKLHAFEMNLNLRIIHPKAIANLLF
jgi:hypothetical protein